MSLLLSKVIKKGGTKMELMTKISFLDDRQGLSETYLEPVEHLRWSFFAKIVNSF